MSLRFASQRPMLYADCEAGHLSKGQFALKHLLPVWF